MMRLYMLISILTSLGIAAAETTFNPAVEIANNLETTSDPFYIPVSVDQNSELRIGWLGINAGGAQTLFTCAEKTLGSSKFSAPVELTPSPPRHKPSFDIAEGGLACWLEERDGVFELLSTAGGGVIATFHDISDSPPHTKVLPVGPFGANQVMVGVLDIGRAIIRRFRYATEYNPPQWIEMEPIVTPYGYQVKAYWIDTKGLTVYLFRSIEPNHPGGDTIYATSYGRKPPLEPMYWTTPQLVTDWVPNGREEAMVVQGMPVKERDKGISAVVHFTFAYDNPALLRRAYAQSAMDLETRTPYLDQTSLTAIEGYPPSLALSKSDLGPAHDTLMFAGQSRFGPIYQVEEVKFRARFPVPGSTPVQTLEVLNAPEKTLRAQGEIPIALVAGASPRMLIVKGNRLLLLNHSSYPIPEPDPTPTPSPTPSPSPIPPSPTATSTPTVDSYLQLLNGMLSRQRTPTAQEFTAGDTNSDQVWDAADLNFFYQQ